MSTNEESCSPVDDTELLYRRVRAGKNLYRYENGFLIFSSQAFSDPKLEPSVDRAVLCENNPEYTKVDETDGVVTLIASEIRKEKVSVNGQDGKISKEYAIDVIPKPLSANPPIKENPAHAVIVPNPQYHNKNAFNKVQKSLAFLANKAGWTIEPIEN